MLSGCALLHIITKSYILVEEKAFFQLRATPVNLTAQKWVKSRLSDNGTDTGVSRYAALVFGSFRVRSLA